MSEEKDSMYGLMLTKHFLEKLNYIKQLPEDQRLQYLQYSLYNEEVLVTGLVSNHETLTDLDLDNLIVTIEKIIDSSSSDHTEFSGAFFNVGKGDA